MLLINQTEIQIFNDRDSFVNQVTITECEITNDAVTLTKKGKLKIPRFYRLRKETTGNRLEFTRFQYDIRRNDFIQIFLESRGVKNPYREYFVVTKTTFTKEEIIIEFEDFTFLLKGVNDITFSFDKQGIGQSKYNNILTFVKEKVDERVEFINNNFLTGSKAIVDVKPLDLGQNIKLIVDKYSFTKVNTAQILDYIRKNFNFFFTFKQENNGGLIEITPILRRLYLDDLDLKHRLSFNYVESYTIIDYDLEYYTDRDMTIQLRGKNFTNQNQDTVVNEYSFIYPEGFIPDRSVDVVFYNLSEEDFRNQVEKLAKSNSYFGWTGNITTHGTLPVSDDTFIQVGDVIRIINAEYFSTAENFINDPEYDEDNENYKVISTKLTYGDGGIRQELEIGNRVTTS